MQYEISCQPSFAVLEVTLEAAEDCPRYVGRIIRGIDPNAPTLSEVSLDPDEAVPLFDEVWRTVELMLAHDLIHGDLSAYNILYWEGSAVVIDFPA